MFKFLSLESETFGLDINESSLKIVKLRKKRGFLQPVSFNEKEIPQRIIENGIIKDEGAFVKNIKVALASIKGEKLRTKYVVASLPEEKSFSQVIQMPKMEMEELKSAVPFEAENYIPLPADQMYLDFKKINPIAGNLDHLDVFITAAEKDIVDSYMSAFKKAGLIPVALEVETEAIARALIKDETSLAPVAIIDFGGDSAGFIVFSGHSIRFTSSISVSSRQITSTISEELGIRSREAEHMKIKYGLSFGKESYRTKAVSKAIKPILENLAKEIQKYLDFYSDHNFHEHLPKKSSRKNKIEKIILSGGGSSLKGIDTFLKNKLNMPVEFGNAWINFPKDFKNPALSELKRKSLSFTTALGLALRSADSET
ncbi:MAG: type IV pilus assembly protein PilM [bacterium]